MYNIYLFQQWLKIFLFLSCVSTYKTFVPCIRNENFLANTFIMLHPFLFFGKERYISTNKKEMYKEKCHCTSMIDSVSQIDHLWNLNRDNDHTDSSDQAHLVDTILTVIFLKCNQGSLHDPLISLE